jgi:serine/threonine protein phosphatase 1
LFVIGDVHGEYDMLISLLDRLPNEADVIFVGDIIDRGDRSSDVVELIRKNSFKAVLGNHEDTFIKFFRDYFSGTSYEDVVKKWDMWLMLNGGKETLISYGFWENPSSKEAIERIKEDLEWMESLPIYIEIEAKHKSLLKVVVSHSNITQVWDKRDKKSYLNEFRETTLRGRDLRYEPKSGIFNIHGHVHTKEPLRGDFGINIDTGACYKDKGYGKLTAYCIEDDRFISVSSNG